MRNLFRIGLYAVPLWVAPWYVHATEPVRDDRVTLTGSVQEQYDSNYTRTPEKNSEIITLSQLGLNLNETWSNQHLGFRWQGTHFNFAKLFDENANLQTGSLDWQSLWPMGFKSSLSIKRDGYLADQLEFAGVDVAVQNLAVARVGYGFADGWLFNLGARGLKQLHSNDALQNSEYKESDGFAEVGYETSSGSSAIVRGRSGKRTYQEEDIQAIRDLNYDYTQAEVETKWIISPKTDLSVLLAKYDRSGEINNGTGTMASLEANWVPTEKITVAMLYSLQHPAIGERTDGTAKAQTTSLSAQWLFSSKLTFATRVSYSRSKYVSDFSVLERSEGLFSYSPLIVSYSPTDHWTIKLDSNWRKNNSPVTYRKYQSAEAALGIYFDY